MGNDTAGEPTFSAGMGNDIAGEPTHTAGTDTSAAGESTHTSGTGSNTSDEPTHSSVMGTPTSVPGTSEAIGLSLNDVDLVRGAVTLDENKTEDPRAWALLPGDLCAMRAHDLRGTL